MAWGQKTKAKWRRKVRLPQELEGASGHGAERRAAAARSGQRQLGGTDEAGKTGMNAQVAGEAGDGARGARSGVGERMQQQKLLPAARPRRCGSRGGEEEVEHGARAQRRRSSAEGGGRGDELKERLPLSARAMGTDGAGGGRRRRGETERGSREVDREERGSPWRCEHARDGDRVRR